MVAEECCWEVISCDITVGADSNRYDWTLKTVVVSIARGSKGFQGLYSWRNTSGWPCCDGCLDGPLETDDGGLGSCILARVCSVVVVDGVAKVVGLQVVGDEA
jgi:hypothetical protein